MNNIAPNGQKFDINFTFYRFIKILNSNDGLTDSELKKTFSLIQNSSNNQTFIDKFNLNILNKIKSEQRLIILKGLFANLDNTNTYDVFVFSIYILKFKPLLLEYSKIIEVRSVLGKEIHPLSLKNDNYSIYYPYSVRVNGALISLIFFDIVESRKKHEFPTSNYQPNFINELFDLYHSLKNKGLEANQIFSIVFQESIAQSGRSNAGSSLEGIVNDVLVEEGISNIEKRIDKYRKDVEYDHLFSLNGKIYGISTKRTLRERYKQFKKTKGAEADVFIQITSGLDLNESKSNTITSNSFDCYIFVFPEIYEKSPLKRMAYFKK